MRMITGKIKKFARLLKKGIGKIFMWVKLKIMDWDWWSSGACHHALFPPSFYYTHTPEEIERIRAEKIKKIQEMIDQMKDH